MGPSQCVQFEVDRSCLASRTWEARGQRLSAIAFLSCVCLDSARHRGIRFWHSLFCRVCVWTAPGTGAFCECYPALQGAQPYRAACRSWWAACHRLDTLCPCTAWFRGFGAVLARLAFLGLGPSMPDVRILTSLVPAVGTDSALTWAHSCGIRHRAEGASIPWACGAHQVHIAEPNKKNLDQKIWFAIHQSLDKTRVGSRLQDAAGARPQCGRINLTPLFTSCLQVTQPQNKARGPHSLGITSINPAQGRSSSRPCQRTRRRQSHPKMSPTKAKRSQPAPRQKTQLNPQCWQRVAKDGSIARPANRFSQVSLDTPHEARDARSCTQSATSCSSSILHRRTLRKECTITVSTQFASVHGKWRGAFVRGGVSNALAHNSPPASAPASRTLNSQAPMPRHPCSTPAAARGPLAAPRTPPTCPPGCGWWGEERARPCSQDSKPPRGDPGAPGDPHHHVRHDHLRTALGLNPRR